MTSRRGGATLATGDHGGESAISDPDQLSKEGRRETNDPSPHDQHAPRFGQSPQRTKSLEERIPMSKSDTPTVVLVHGGFVDGSGWQGVCEQLRQDGYNVSVVQNPTLSLADDVSVTKRAIDAASEPVILVGHSYGGAVVTEAGPPPQA